MISKQDLLLLIAETLGKQEFMDSTAYWITDVQIREDVITFLVHDDYSESVWHTLKLEAT